MARLLAAVLLLSCAWPAAAAARHPDTLTDVLIGEVTSLDPAGAYDNASQGLIYNVYETLIAYDGPRLNRFVPVLSTRVPSRRNGLISKDGRVYRFPIRKGVRFQDGSLMTPEDVRYSLMRFMLYDRAGGPSALLLQPILGASSTRDASGKMRVSFADVEKAVRVKGGTVVITLKRPFAPFLAIMARWSYVMSRSWAAEHGDWDGKAGDWEKYNDIDQQRSYFFAHMDGTGPFELERWDRTANYVLLKRFDGYWRRPARLKRIVLRAEPEFSTRRLMLQSGDADIIETPRPLLGQLRGLPGVRIVDHLPSLSTDPALFFTFRINPLGNPDIGSGKLDGDGIPPDFFSDPDVRKGFACAMDYQALIRDTFMGAAVRAKGPVPPGVPGYDPRQPYYRFDLKKAAEHLRKAWGGRVWREGFRFTLTYNVGSENRQAACEILKKNVESLNPKFKIDLRGVEWASFLDKAQRRLMPIFARGWYADYPDAHNFVYAFYDSDGRYPSAQGFRDPELDRLIEEAAGQLNGRRRAALYRRILALGYKDVPSIVTVHTSEVVALRSWVRGFYRNPVFLGNYYYPLGKD